MYKIPNFVPGMVRNVLTYALTSLILLSQVGLPLHFHYCKGMLESVSILFNDGCDDHGEVALLPSCCQKSVSGHCDKDNDNCCDDQIRILSQDLASLTPHFFKWTDIPFEAPTYTAPETIAPQQEQQFSSLPVASADHGPPRYILHHALVLYA